MIFMQPIHVADVCVDAGQSERRGLLKARCEEDVFLTKASSAGCLVRGDARSWRSISTISRRGRCSSSPQLQRSPDGEQK